MMTIEMTRKDFKEILTVDGIIELYKNSGLVVSMRQDTKTKWDELLLECPYIPVAYATNNIDFLLEHQLGNGVEIYDLSCIIKWDNKPVAIWPLFLSFRDGLLNLFFLDNNVLPPLILQSCAPSSEKLIIKGCQNFADQIVRLCGNGSWTSMESFMGNIGLSSWHVLSMAKGAKPALNHEVFLDLSLSMVEIKSQFRKSFKSLITSGQRLWNVGVLDYDDKEIWNEFTSLHLQVAGRKTRSDETWEIQYSDILNNGSLLVYLRNQEGEMVGAGLFNFTRDEGLYAVGAYDREQFDKPLGHVVQYRAIEELKKRNVRWYKLGARPYPTHFPTPSDKEISIGEFKHGFASHLFPRIVLEHTVPEMMS
jgi:FemAB family protein